MKAAYELWQIWKNLPNELKTIDIYIIYEAQTLPWLGMSRNTRITNVGLFKKVS